MIRTQIQLTEAQARTLKALASARQSSVAELIRQSVNHLSVDTSALFAVLDADDQNHKRARRAWANLLTHSSTSHNI